MNKVFLQLGSNIEPRKIFLSDAINLIKSTIGKISKISKVYESTPWGVDNQMNYLNQIIVIDSLFNENELLDKILEIEKNMGRIRIEKWGERIIDIDILFYNNEIIEKANLCIPHKHLHRRKFVLKPLNEVASDFIHPKYRLTISELLEKCEDLEIVEEYVT